MDKKLAIVISHPIQYYSPLFQKLAKSCTLNVFYTLGNIDQSFDIGFQREIKWDVPLLEDYNHSFVKNTAKKPGYHHFMGIVNPELISEIQNFGPQAILFYGWSYYSHFKAMRHFKNKVPIWFRGDSNLIDKQSLFRKLARKFLLRNIYANVDKAFYVGTANKNYFKEFGLKEEQLVFAPHAVDNERFGESHSNEAVALRSKFGLIPGDILVLFSGKLEEKKDPALLLNAFLEIDTSNMHLLIVGNGALEENLKVESKMNGYHNRIHFLDFQNQSFMPAVYQACDLFCLPSKGPNETWGLAINEAMAAGRAVLVSNKVGCCQDLVRENYNGAVFESENLLDLKKKLILFDDLSKLELFGKNSLKIIAQWSLDNQVQKIIQNLDKINLDS